MRYLPLIFIVVVVVTCAQPALYAVTVQQIVDQISTTSYQNFLTNTLPTHDGSNRCQNWGVSNGVVGHGAQHDPCADAAFLAFRRSGWTTYYVPFSLREDGTGNLWYGRDIIAVKQGTTRPDDIYMLSGHYDSTANHESGTWTTCPGADDDGSGIAGLLEIARITSQYSFPATIVLCAFDGEEQTVVSSGITYRRIGSTYYSNLLQSQGIVGNIKGMISVDMIAWLTPYASDPSTGEDLRNKLDIEARTTMTTINSQIASAVTAYGGGLTLNIRGNPGDFSDHVSFADKGVQAVQIIEDGWWSNPNYHHMTDSADGVNYLNYDYATKMLKVTTGWLCTQALAP